MQLDMSGAAFMRWLKAFKSELDKASVTLEQQISGNPEPPFGFAMLPFDRPETAVPRPKLPSQFHVPVKPFNRTEQPEPPKAQAKKSDMNKPPIALVPRAGLELEALAFEHGRKKYGAWNWCLGLPHERLASAALRHIIAWMDGEDNDPESGVSHIGHARACLGMIAGNMASKLPGLDDRRPLKKP